MSKLFFDFTKNSFKKNAREIWVFFLDLVFPIECQNCGIEGWWLCPTCFCKLKFKSFQHCPDCAKENESGKFCRSCRKGSCLEGIISAFDYSDELAGRLIKKMKYNFAQDIGLVLGDALALFFSKSVLGKEILKQDNLLAIPVPLHIKREKWRGFNQSEIIAKRFSKNLEIPFEKDFLKRKIHKKPQARLSEKFRRENVVDNFYCQGDIAGRIIILIDDVATTGATLGECAKVLKKAGAKKIWGLTIANG